MTPEEIQALLASGKIDQETAQGLLSMAGARSFPPSQMQPQAMPPSFPPNQQQAQSMPPSFPPSQGQPQAMPPSYPPSGKPTVETVAFQDQRIKKPRDAIIAQLSAKAFGGPNG